MAVGAILLCPISALESTLNSVFKLTLPKWSLHSHLAISPDFVFNVSADVDQ